jgi:3-deoxy-manno-octulosonate cytidylyltransferase (CMP-KDO synthetase)
MLAKVVIPARFASSRFPGKPLASLLGKSMIEHVYERAKAARRVDDVWVATDDARIEEAVKSFGGNVILTRPEHPSGTHRVKEAAERVGGDLVVNLQGDEPLIRPEQIDQVVQALEEDSEADMATLKLASEDQDEIWDPNRVKVVTDRRGYALYFSRAPIPFYREAGSPAGERRRGVASWGRAWIHIGLYGYRKEVLMAASDLVPSPWDEAEQLEQLRFLYWGYRIRVLETTHRTIGVDVPEDVLRVERAMIQREFEGRE